MEIRIMRSHMFFNNFRLILGMCLRVIILYYLSTFLASCTKDDSIARGKSSKNTSEPSSIATGGPDLENRDGGDKPSDDSGGIPGYLIDPQMIGAFYNDSKTDLLVQADPNAIKSGDGELDKAVLTFWEISNTDLAEKKYIERDGQKILPGAVLCSFHPESDGSFKKTVKATKGLILTSNQVTSTNPGNICAKDTSAIGIVIELPATESRDTSTPQSGSNVTSIKIVPSSKWDTVFPENEEGLAAGTKSSGTDEKPIGTFDALSF